MPRAIGIGSHFIFVSLSAEFSLDRNDSFLWKFCFSLNAREEVKVRDGTEWRAWREMGGGSRVRADTRMSERVQVVLISASSTCNADEQEASRHTDRQQSDGGGVVSFCEPMT